MSDSKSRNYKDGHQDAWIEAIRENCHTQVAEIHTRLDGLHGCTKELIAKVNHIYGGAVILGAIAGFVGSIVVGVIVALLTRRGAP